MVLTSNKNIAFSITFKSNITLIYILERCLLLIEHYGYLFETGAPTALTIDAVLAKLFACAMHTSDHRQVY